jgi:predicted carbohydrate-binding protein with CBM48
MKTDDESNPLRPLQGAAPAPNEHFVDAVMRQLATRPLPRPTLWQRLFAERELRLRVRPAALLGGALALAALVVVLRPARTQTVAVAPLPASSGRTSDGPVLVRFALAAPRAQTVALAGDFNGWRSDVTPLTRGPDGVWQARVPLTAGNWSYSFVVDGHWVEDPLADTWRADGFGGKNAVVRVGDGPALVGSGRGG